MCVYRICVSLFYFILQIFIVFDSRNYWNAPATYRKIENLRLETIKETAIRAFNEQISVTNRDDNQVVDNYIINDKHQLGLDNYVEYQFDNLPWGEMTRTIGLFAIKVDKTKNQFQVQIQEKIKSIRLFYYYLEWQMVYIRYDFKNEKRKSEQSI